MIGESMSHCAYCESPGPFTREHIWPSTLIRKFDQLRTYNSKTNRFYIGDPVVKDVCAGCNNGRLSQLDMYLDGLYDLCFSSIVRSGEDARLDYDYDLLLRALLKISYNSARSSNNLKSKALLSKFAKFILNGSFCPKIVLRLQVVTSSKVINLADKTESVLDPQPLRCGILAYDGPLSHRFLVRTVWINSFCFYLVMSYRNEPDHKWRDFLQYLSVWKTPTGIPLSSKVTTVHIAVDKTTYMNRELLGTLLYADNVLV